MARKILGLLFVYWLTAPLVAQPQPTFTIDLNGDGRQEHVTLVPYTVEGGQLGQLVVRDKAGRNLWAGPRSKTLHSPNPFVFLGEFDLGGIEVVGDVDGDGKVELIATYQKSDVRPTHFRQFRWNGRAFVHVRDGSLLPVPQKPATFQWSKPDPASTRWVERLVRFRQGAVLAKVQENTGLCDMWLRWQSGQGFVLTTP